MYAKLVKKLKFFDTFSGRYLLLVVGLLAGGIAYLSLRGGVQPRWALSLVGMLAFTGIFWSAVRMQFNVNAPVGVRVIDTVPAFVGVTILVAPRVYPESVLNFDSALILVLAAFFLVNSMLYCFGPLRLRAGLQQYLRCLPIPKGNTNRK